MHSPLPLHRSLRSIDELIAEKEQQIRELRERRRELQLQAAVTARNLMRSYEISMEELAGSIEVDEAAGLLSETTAARRVRRIAASRRNLSSALLPELRPSGPLSRLATTVRTVLANQGFTTFAAIARLVDEERLSEMNGVGPTREAHLRQWLADERANQLKTAAAPGGPRMPAMGSEACHARGGSGYDLDEGAPGMFGVLADTGSNTKED